MEFSISKTPKELGEKAAKLAKNIILEAIKEKGYARIVLSTGASQFEFFESFTKQDIPFEKVEMFHLDEYVSLSIDHKASFRKYLLERFINKVPIKKYHLIDGCINLDRQIEELTKKINESPIDLGLIGIGENAHIAFNDPPADFNTKEAYIVVNLNDTCKSQQVREGWFKDNSSVPKQAISMTVSQILKCKKIISCVPNIVKANAIKDMVNNPLDTNIPATALKTHPNIYIFLDNASASKL